jgi:hypothetical protein
MSSDVDGLTVEDWTARIKPHLSVSLQTVSEKITNAPPVQAWLRRASTQAAEALGPSSGLQGPMQGYMQLTDDLETAFPNLVTAVRALTHGCGRLDLDWRPLNPTLSRLYIAFDRDLTVTVFCSLSDCTPEAARSVLDTVAAALPEGEPFPNRPNTATGLVARGDTALGVRVKAHADPERGRYRTVTLLPKERSPLENLTPRDAERALLQLLCSEAAVSG